MSAPLSLWNKTPTRQAILDFVAAVATPGSPDFVPPAERIAVFDNDGTLWCEKPMYIQMDFILRQMVARAASEPGLRTQQPWQAAWEQDYDWFGEAITNHYRGDDSTLRVVLGGLLDLSEGQVVEAVEASARTFVFNERHPTLGMTYRDCVYQPMVELLRYLEANAFTNFIVSGGGRDFMRGFAQDLYGVPRERVIGSTRGVSLSAGRERRRHCAARRPGRGQRRSGQGSADLEFHRSPPNPGGRQFQRRPGDASLYRWIILACAAAAGAA